MSVKSLTPTWGHQRQRQRQRQQQQQQLECLQFFNVANSIVFTNKIWFTIAIIFIICLDVHCQGEWS
ncbi:unnamed protein product [Ceratitis capitata]|uniref:(Mediterranean fruit fly) hypothetical protein n=1 Tax=Ceratitis capitata TaxID=7213 RepID=A0A811UCS7_CERCA|nr:unnamed protein product [Ceratitis capitata]